MEKMSTRSTICEIRSEVCDFFSGKTVFITGSTGFLGKVLVHKLLTTCSNVKKIYLLIRPDARKGTKSQERLVGLLKAPIFDKIKAENPELLDKLVAVSGDLTSEDLGISAEVREELFREVNIIFHSAATVKFDEEIEKSINMNVKGTKRMVQLAKDIRHLDVFVHVSTAYCHCQRTKEEIIEEKVYLDSNLSTNVEDRVKLLSLRPNTYTLTKAMTENMLPSIADGLPIVIIRPSIVGAASKEPLPGWVDNLNGPTGMLVGAGAGVLRSMYVLRDCTADIIPVDIVINLMCAAAYKRANSTTAKEITVYNCTSGQINPIKWRRIEDLGRILIRKYPQEKILWYPGGQFLSSKWLTKISWFFTNWLPALLVDLLCLLSGNKPFLYRLNMKIRNAMMALEFFSSNEWTWSNENVTKLWEETSTRDRDLFNFDVSCVDWREYFSTYVQGARRFVMKSDPSTLEASRSRLKWLRALHFAVSIVVPAIISYIIYTLIK